MPIVRCRRLARGFPLALAASFFVAAASSGAAQVPLFVRLDNAQTPPGQDWRWLETPHFRIIYPDSLREQSRRVAALLESTRARLTKSLPVSPERISVVLNNQALVSNAFVDWAPRRSLWYTLPPVTVETHGPIDWYTLLAVHEGRHIVQERAIRTGWIGLAGRLFGEETTALLGASLYFPIWFWEGDAVGMETALTEEGRGRQPTFDARVRALRLAGRPYRYAPAWHGSYRTYYPDWYTLGYLLTTHVRRHYGADAWSNVIRRAAWWPIPPFALSYGLRRTTGRSLGQIHRDAIAELDSLWQEQVQGIVETPARQLSPRNADYHTWTTPQLLPDGSVIAEYSDLGQAPALVRLQGGRRETLIARVALRGDHQFHTAAGRAVWVEYEPNARFVEQSWLSIVLYDVERRQLRRLTSRTRYLGPALSPDGTKIATIHFSETGRSSVHVLDAENGRVLQTLPNVEGHRLITPRWTADGGTLLVVAVDSARGNALVRLDPGSGTSDTLIAFRHDAIAGPVAWSSYVFFASPRSGIDNVYALDVRDGKEYRVTSRHGGARQPSISPDGKRLVFQDYSVDGWDIAEMDIDPTRWEPADRVESRSIEYFAPLVEQERSATVASDGPSADTAWRTGRYRGPSTLLDFHSVSITPSNDETTSGIALHSRNLLNTFGASIGYLFNTNEKTHSVEAGVSYAGLLPVFDAAVRVGSRASSYIDTSDVEVPFTWNERAATFGARIPLVRVRGLTVQRLSFGATLGLTRISGQPVDFFLTNNNGDLRSLSYSVSASHFLGSAARDLTPLGVSALGVYRHTPLPGDYEGHQASLSGSAYLPGLLRHHRLVLDGVVEEQRPANYRFSAIRSFPRGYDSRFHERFVKGGATYQLPLWYPDLAIGPLAYVRRVQGGGFADWGRGGTRTDSLRRYYRSLGTEVTADVAPLSTRWTVRVGARYSYRIDAVEPHRWDVVFGLF